MIPSSLSLLMFLYTGSALFGWRSWRHRSRYSGRVTQCTYLAGAVMAGALLINGMFLSGSIRILNHLNGVFLTLVILGALFLVMEIHRPVKYFRFILSMLSAALVIMAMLMSATREDKPLQEGVAGHVIFIYVALAAFSLSFLTSLCYLTQERVLHRKDFPALSFGLPSLEMIGRLNFFFMTIGVTGLIVGVANGVTYFGQTGASFDLFIEPTVIISLLVIMIYLVVLILKLGHIERDRRIAYASICAYMLLILAFLVNHRIAETVAT